MTPFLLLAVSASALLSLGLLMMKSRGEVLPAARGIGAFHAVIVWIRDPVWISGLGIQTLGFALYILAVAGAPVSMVAVMMQGGIALFILMAVVFLGERARPREWIGIGTISAAMLMLTLSLSARTEPGALRPLRLAVLAVIAGSAAATPMVSRRFDQRGVATATASGIAFGLGSLFTKAMADTFLTTAAETITARVILNPYVYLTVLANVAGLVMLQNSFRTERGIIAAPLSAAVSNLVPIAGGMIAFGESLPADSTAATMRVGAFFLTTIAGALLAGSAPLTTDGAHAETRRVLSPGQLSTGRWRQRQRVSRSL